MIERPSRVMASADSLHTVIRLVVFAAVLALPACVSDADPREGNQGPRDVRSGSDVGNTDARDAARNDAQDSYVPEDSDDDRSMDAVGERSTDAESDSSARDGSDGTSSPDAMDISTDPVVPDAVTDTVTSDADARIDGVGTDGAVDAGDASPPIDVIDSGVPADASDGDATSADALGDGGDASDMSDTGADGGVVVFYQEDFTTSLGTFSAQTVCMTSHQWAIVSGYAHAAEPITTGVSRISNSPVPVPANMSNITLRASHRFDTEPGYDAGQLLISVNGGAATLVTTFTAGGYTAGGQTNPTNCSLTNTPGAFPGWSGNQSEWVSEVNLSAMPFNVVAGNTVTITFRMTTDNGNLSTGNGWDINWVSLSGTSP